MNPSPINTPIVSGPIKLNPQTLVNIATNVATTLAAGGGFLYQRGQKNVTYQAKIEKSFYKAL